MTPPEHDSFSLEWGLKFCISNKFIDSADAADPGTSLWQHIFVEWWTDLKICYIIYSFCLYLENPHISFYYPTQIISLDQRPSLRSRSRRNSQSYLCAFYPPLNNSCLVEKSLFPFLWWYNALLIYFLPDPLNLFWLCSPMNSCFFHRDCFYFIEVFGSSNPFHGYN